ncbi:MAG: histidine kinase dimerization/phospho-acceptor domain-containing protein, partial [Pseudomonadota bacterium]
MEFDAPRQILRGLPQPVLIIDRYERIRVANPAAQEIFGTVAEGRHYGTIIRQPAMLDAIDRAFTTHQSVQGRYVQADLGVEIIYRVIVTPFFGDTISGLVLSFQDITPEETVGQMRRDFVANVSHELRTPLTALMGFIETLKGTARDDASAHDRFLRIMEKEAGRMNRLVDDLLSLSRVESEERMRPSTCVNVAALAKGSVLALHPTAQEQDVILEVHCEQDEMLTTGESDQLT